MFTSHTPLRQFLPAAAFALYVIPDGDTAILLMLFRRLFKKLNFWPQLVALALFAALVHVDHLSLL
jgi:hypothetical protein